MLKPDMHRSRRSAWHLSGPVRNFHNTWWAYRLLCYRLTTSHLIVPLMMTKDIDRVPPRCQRLLLRLLRFNPQAVHVPGKSLVIADVLSRSPVRHSQDDTELAQQVALYVDTIERSFSAGRLAELHKATVDDSELRDVIRMTMSGWPSYGKDVPRNIRFFQLRHHLSVYFYHLPSTLRRPHICSRESAGRRVEPTTRWPSRDNKV